MTEAARLLTLKEFALALNESPGTVRARRASGWYPEAVKIGGSWRYPESLRDELVAEATSTLTTDEVAERLRVHAMSVCRWARLGKLPGAYKDRGRSWRVPTETLEGIIAGEIEVG